MIRIDIEGLPEVQRKLRNLAQEQLPFAISTALNNTAFSLLNTSKQQLTSVFDRPTPLITGATRVTKATKDSFTAIVEIDPRRRKVLSVHETGGQRGLQGLERALRAADLLPAGYRLVPADNMELDVYGNPPAAVVKAVKRWLLSGEYRVSRNRRYFVIPLHSQAHLSPGIYLESAGNAGKGTGVYRNKQYRMRMHTGLFMIVREGVYRKRLEWQLTMRTEAERVLPQEMAKAINRAIATAR